MHSEEAVGLAKVLSPGAEWRVVRNTVSFGTPASNGTSAHVFREAKAANRVVTFNPNAFNPRLATRVMQEGMPDWRKME
jgi:hypothetical protein